MQNERCRSKIRANAKHPGLIYIHFIFILYLFLPFFTFEKKDEKMINPQLLEVLSRVRQSADIMPKQQLYHQLESELGAHWRDHFVTFDETPIAAASIGQVHKGVLKDGRVVAVKVRSPGALTYTLPP